MEKDKEVTSFSYLGRQGTLYLIKISRKKLQNLYGVGRMQRKDQFKDKTLPIGSRENHGGSIPSNCTGLERRAL